MVQQFSENSNKDNVVKFFARNFHLSASFFEHNITTEVANSNLLNVIDIIWNWNSKTLDQDQAASINQFEKDAIEYLGGFLIYKAKFKFPTLNSILNLMTQPTPTGKLIKAIEKRKGSLYYPHQKFVSLLHTIYFKCSHETSKPSNQINFNSVRSSILSHPHYQSYLEEILYDENNTIAENEEQVHKILEYVVRLFVRMLSYTFAKRLFHNLFHKSTKNAKSLRASLQASSSH